MSGAVRLAGVDPTDLFAVWPWVSAWIEAACARPGCDLRPVELLVLCLNAEGQLITALDEAGEPAACAVSQVRDHSSGRRSCWVLAVGGAACHWPAALDQIEAGARANGCHTLEFVGRPGWRRLLSGYAVEPCPAGLHFAKSLREAA